MVKREIEHLRSSKELITEFLTTRTDELYRRVEADLLRAHDTNVEEVARLARIEDGARRARAFATESVRANALQELLQRIDELRRELATELVRAEQGLARLLEAHGMTA
ncbi:MAG: hypothetical protein IPH13_21725 [Planctomycetes bacterium]|nr:hypothetical protein [Planctomycetota bacterium]